MKKYDSMKDSGVPWLGFVPEHWSVERAKTHFRQTNSRGNETPVLLAATQKFGMYPQNKLDGVVKVKEGTDLQEFKTVHKGDFVISLRSFQGGFERSDYEGVCSPAYQTFHAFKEIDEDYFKLFFKSFGFINAMNALTVGIREGKNIKFDDFANSQIVFPPIEEQKGIAQYLIRKCDEIDKLIEDVGKSIENYSMWRKAIIFEAVTGRNKTWKKTKYSGMEWLGEIPKDWHMVKVTRILDYNHTYPVGDGDHGLVKPTDYKDEGIPYIRVQNLGWGTEISLENVVFISDDTNKKIASSTLQPNDILFAKTGATIGKTGIIPQSIPIANTTSHVGKITVDSKYNQKYILYVLSSLVGYNQFWESASKKTTRPELSIDEIKAIKVILPNSREEQDSIAEYLDGAVSEIDGMIGEKQIVVNELLEYKRSLIYEVVTGKRKVV